MSASLNNFLASVSADVPLGDDMSIMVSGRIDLLALEYRMFRGLLPDLLEAMVSAGRIHATDAGLSFGYGLSRGLEFMYEYNGDDFQSRLSYTLFKTDRFDPSELQLRGSF